MKHAAWPDVAGATAVKLREDGLSYAEIQVALRRKGHSYSREAVQGFVRRYIKNGGVIPPKQSSGWPPGAEDLAKALWGQEKPHLEVAQRLSEMFGRPFTRYAVSSRLARLGLTRTPAESLRLQRRNAVLVNDARGAKPRKAPQPKPVSTDTPVAPAAGEKPPMVSLAHDRLWKPLAGVEPISLFDRGRMQCNWPIDDIDGVSRFCCGAPVSVQGGEPLRQCATHYTWGHAKPQPGRQPERRSA